MLIRGCRSAVVNLVFYAPGAGGDMDICGFERAVSLNVVVRVLVPARGSRNTIASSKSSLMMRSPTPLRLTDSSAAEDGAWCRIGEAGSWFRHEQAARRSDY